MNRKLLIGLFSILLASVSSVTFGQIFPVETGALAYVTTIKADIIFWGIMMIGVWLTMYAYRRIRALIDDGSGDHEPEMLGPGRMEYMQTEAYYREYNGLDEKK